MKNARSNSEKVNPHHNTRQNFCMKIGLLIHGFRVTVFLLLKKIFMSFHAGVAGEKLLGPYFVPQLRTGAFAASCYEFPCTVVARCGSADWDSYVVHE
jgi:hypothetical protein